ncbi:MFS transporter [Streptomyces sp. NBC_01498]|uniref:MFS transporter n=1 Tax=Streptomyces sp. NBC_01498 TaxID=2975870 RepID=UPI002E7C3D26|nr:MFS transporter [Streptomyces sp. NBC_01498]WTL27447.1 MFS transporter [Streptomyces sp. NBC_01498]
MTTHGVTAGTAVTDTARAPAWRGGFGRLWSAAIISRFGDGLRTAALPLLAASLTDDPLLIASVTACGFLPWLLFGLLGGALADRVDQRRAMWTADLLRAALMAGFALAVALDLAGIALLLALAFLLTTVQTLFDNAATALLPAVVPRSALAGANARLMAGQQVAGGFLGAPLVPALLVLGASAPFTVNAATYLVGALLIASLRTRAPDRAPKAVGGTLRAEMAEGMRTLWRDGPLRGLAVATALSNVGIGALIATLVLHITGWLDAGNSGYAAALTAYGAASVAGGLLAPRLALRIGRIRSVLVAGIVQTCALLVLGTVRELWAAIGVMALFGVMGMVWNVNQATLVQERSPAGMLGRISSAFRTLAVAGAPLGALLGGLAASAWGLNAPALLAAGAFTLAVASLGVLIN